MRHRSRVDPDQGRQAARRQLPHHRHEDLHLGGRARSRSQYRASRAGAHRRRARRHQGAVAVRGAEIRAPGGRLARRPQRRHLRLDRREDGHSRQFDLRHELRRRGRLAGGQRERGPARHVHDDERGAARRRRAGPGALRGRVSERGRLRQGAPAGARDHRREIQGQAGGPDHRPSGRAPRPDDHARLQRGGARAGDLDRAQGRRRAPLQRRRGTAGRRRPHEPAHAGHQGRADRPGLRQYGGGATDFRRPRLHQGNRHGAVRARCPHPDDL